jgi:uncharacterized protein
MTKKYFFDTSGLIKLYHQEIGTEVVELIFSDPGSLIYISELSHVEFRSALTRMFRTQEINIHAKEEALKNFRKDCKKKFIIIALSSKTIRKAVEIIEKHGHTFSIRTLDALQLAAYTLKAESDIEFVCADLNLIKICKLEGLKVLNPETN